MKALVNHRTDMQVHRLITEIFQEVLDHSSDERISLGTLVDALSERGFALLLMVFAAPMALPLPAPPGLTTVMAIPLFFFFAQMMFGKKTPWIPDYFRKKTLSRATLVAFTSKLDPLLHRIRFLLSPRLFYMTGNHGERFIGMIGFIFSMSIALPIPLSNTVPSIAVECMALGLFVRDGIWVKAGMLVGSLWIVGLLLLASSAVAYF